MLVASAADTVANSALVAKFPPSPRIALIEVIAALELPMLVASVAERATAKSLTDVMRVLAVPILVASVPDNATAKSLTDVILVLAVPILVARAADTVASSALVAKSKPLITVLTDVIAAALTEVKTETAQYLYCYFQY